MYVLKKLRNVNAVQTLSRLNRICPPFDKKTFILDFVNKYEDIVAAFKPYYTTTLLANSVTPSAVYAQPKKCVLLRLPLSIYLVLVDFSVNKSPAFTPYTLHSTPEKSP